MISPPFRLPEEVGPDNSPAQLAAVFDVAGGMAGIGSSLNPMTTAKEFTPHIVAAIRGAMRVDRDIKAGLIPDHEYIRMVCGWSNHVDEAYLVSAMRSGSDITYEGYNFAHNHWMMVDVIRGWRYGKDMMPFVYSITKEAAEQHLMTYVKANEERAARIPF